MIITDEQKQAIQQNLTKAVKYNETYQELYDHVLSSLEAKPSVVDLQQDYTRIIIEDFGGQTGISNIEKSRIKAIKLSIHSNYLSRFAMFFKWPGLLLPALLIALAYYDISIYSTSYLGALLFMACVFLPWAFLVVRNFIVGLKLKEVKNTYSNAVMTDIAVLPFRVYCFAKAILIVFKIQMGPYVEHVFFILLIIHVVIFCLMSVKQLKVSLK